MNLHVRALAASFIVAAAFAAFAAPSASAFEFFKAEEQLTAFRGSQTESADFKFTTGIGAAEIICTAGNLRGMFAAEGGEKNPQKSKTLDTSDGEAGSGVVYSGCTFEGGATTFASNHCNYRFHAQEETVDVIKNGTVTEESECEKSGMTFTISKTGCVVSIKPEAKNVGLGNSVTLYKNGTKTGKERFFELFPGFSKIKYSASATCKKSGTFEDGEYIRGTQQVLGYTGTLFTTRAGLFME